MYEKIKDLQIGILGLFIALGVTFAALITTNNLSRNNISVTGSAYETVKSDSATWTFSINAKSPTRVQAYKTIKTQIPIVKKYLTDKGFSDSQIEIMLANTYESFKYSPKTGYTTNEIEHYNYQQPIKISSKDVEKVKDLASSYQELTEKDIDIRSDISPEYQYSNMANLKIELLEKATLDAKNRAKSMLKSNHNRVGKIRSAKMGVFQITPTDSTDVSDMGINDLSTIEKKVTAVANITFAIK